MITSVMGRRPDLRAAALRLLERHDPPAVGRPRAHHHELLGRLRRLQATRGPGHRQRLGRIGLPGGGHRLHDGGGDRSQTVAALPQIISQLAGPGLLLRVTLPAARPASAPAAPDERRLRLRCCTGARGRRPPPGCGSPGWPLTRPRAATGWRPPTAGSSPTPAPPTSGRSRDSASTPASPVIRPGCLAHRPRATGWPARTAGSSPSATPASTGRWAPNRSTSP